MNNFRIALILSCLTGLVNHSLAQNGNQPYIRFILFTGGDDLRNGQNVTVSLFPNPDMGNYPEFRDVNMNQGRGSASNTSFSYVFPLGNGWTPNSFKAFKILHDGSGHNAFEGYDNWNLDRVRVVFVDPNATPRNTVLLDLSGQPLVRFTGDKRGQSWTFAPQQTQNSNTTANAFPAPDVRIVRWVSPVTGDFESMPEGRHTDAQL